ncbi:hypothetical protein CDV31_015647 [Fusarium ambrosium]|uniref:Uncharacterized protein n=1 Tax=Fusarium ambrosium TaxID=131363 RepID=A0A428SLM2_9HYPO|nr:hypothetical protein CDV31_015647 [Fusarium ambrosium]
MAEALAALGVAANVLQFIECGYRIVKAVQELKSDKDEFMISTGETEMLAKSLNLTLGQIQIGCAIPIPPHLSTPISTCIELSEKLGRLLDDIKVSPKEKPILKRIQAWFKTYTKVDEIKSLDNRLTLLRTNICDQLNLGLLNELVAREVSENSFRGMALQRLGQLSQQLSDLSSSRPWDDSKETLQKEKEETLKTFTKIISALSSELKYHRPINRVLRSLHFRQIKERISDVHSAHPTTLKWIFGNSPEANVAEWMSSTDNNDLYWISGYAGSGKSTLMKFLVNHQRTIQLLKEWSGDNPLIVANHFFWSAGTPIQKSQEGLFRTLLFQIMLRDVDLIPVLCPNRWATNSFEHLEPWTRTELLETFQRLADLTTRKTRICLFIDGLDEYRGDHRELLSVLFKISKAPHLKVCASSRPWIEFRQAFEASQWKLSVQDLTAEDIRKYCMNKLCPDEPAYAWMECHNKVAAGVLANEICRKAQGVFLWVFLVVRSLLKGLSNGDSMCDLQERLEELPSDLEAYFRLMLDNIDTVYRRRTAKVFQSLVHTNSSLPVLLFHFFDLEESNPNYALDNSITPMRDSQALPIVRAKRTQLIAQCKDLVQFSCDTHEPAMLRDRVSFLHRTVSDFFRKDSMDKLLSERVGQGFEPRLTLARAYLAMIKSVPPWWLESSVIRPERVHRFAKNTSYYIGQLERLDMTSDTEPIRQELKRTLDTLQLEGRDH